MKKAFYLALMVPVAGMLPACSYFAAKADPRTQVRNEMEDVLEDFVVPESAVPTVYTVEMKDAEVTPELIAKVKNSFTTIPMLEQGSRVKAVSLKYVADKKNTLNIQIDRTLNANGKEVNRSASVELTHEDGSAQVFTALDGEPRNAALRELDFFSRVLIADEPEAFAKSVTVSASMMINVNTKKAEAELNEAHIANSSCNVYKVALRDIYSGKNAFVYVTSDNNRFLRQIVMPGLALVPGAEKVTITAPDYTFINGAWVPATLDVNGTVYKLAVKESTVTMAPGYEMPAVPKDEEEAEEEKIDKDAAAEDSEKEDAEQAAEEKTEEAPAEEAPAEE